MKERLLKHWITSGLGLILLAFVIVKFILKFESLTTWSLYIPYGVGALVGFLLFRAKDTWLIKTAQGLAGKATEKIK